MTDEATMASLEAMRAASLDELEETTWPPPPDGAGHLQRRCHELRRVPLGQFGVEDVRIMLSQQIGTQFLLPMAVGMLAVSPLAEGDYYPGDLLMAVLQLPKSAWNGHEAAAGVLGQVLAHIDLSNPDLGEVADAIRDWLANRPV